MNILYVGGFILPDKNAAAQRVISLAKALRELGHNVFFLNAPKESVKEGWKEYFGFECFEYEREKIYEYLTSIKKIVHVIEEKKVSAVIAYNHPAIALNKLVLYCRKNNIKCYADATEWYVAKGNPLFKIIKNYDSNTRMKKVHFKMDGVIAISRYLYEYYKNEVNTMQIPPLVDLEDEKWASITKQNTGTVKFIYAGSPDSQKERLDILVDTIESIAQKNKIQLDIVGITQKQYESIYGVVYRGSAVKFHGRVSHSEALRFVKEADWSVIIRENNLVVKAGFPTKIPESISAGTPIIANRFSNIDDYLDDTNSILIDAFSELPTAIERAVTIKLDVKNDLFDYRKYILEIKKMFIET